MIGSIASILVDGLAYAMFLFIVSVGLSVTMGLMGFVNLAHGAFAMAGGYVVLTAMRYFGVPFVASLVLTFFIVGAISVANARRIEAGAARGEALRRRLALHRVMVQVIGMVSIFVTAFWGMLQNFNVPILPG